MFLCYCKRFEPPGNGASNACCMYCMYATSFPFFGREGGGGGGGEGISETTVYREKSDEQEGLAQTFSLKPNCPIRQNLPHL